MRQSLLKKLNEKITDITKLEIKITTMGKSHERRQCLHCSMMGYDWLFISTYIKNGIYYTYTLMSQDIMTSHR